MDLNQLMAKGTTDPRAETTEPDKVIELAADVYFGSEGGQLRKFFAPKLADLMVGDFYLAGFVVPPGALDHPRGSSEGDFAAEALLPLSVGGLRSLGSESIQLSATGPGSESSARRPGGGYEVVLCNRQYTTHRVTEEGGKFVSGHLVRRRALTMHWERPGRALKGSRTFPYEREQATAAFEENNTSAPSSIFRHTCLEQSGAGPLVHPHKAALEVMIFSQILMTGILARAPLKRMFLTMLLQDLLAMPKRNRLNLVR